MILPVETPAEIGKIVEIAERNDAAIILYDEKDRLISASHYYKEIYKFIDFSVENTYDAMARKTVECEVLDDPAVYLDIDAWLNDINTFRRRYKWAQYLVSHNTGKTYLAHHQRFDGFGCVALRFDITDRLHAGEQNNFPCLSGFDPISGKWFASTLTRNFDEPTGIVARNGKLIDANKGFMDILYRKDGVLLNSGKLFLQNRNENTQFHKIIDEQSKSFSNGSQILRASRKDNGLYYILSVFTIFMDSFAQNRNLHEVVLVSVVDPYEKLPVDVGTIKDLFGLTSTEARVAINIGSGDDVSEIAATHGVSIGTIRNQLKAVFAKMGVNRQSELVRLLHRISSIYRSSSS